MTKAAWTVRGTSTPKIGGATCGDPPCRLAVEGDVDRAKSVNKSIRKATDYVHATMIRENGGKPVVYLMDAPRRIIYKSMSESNVRWMNELLEEKTAHYNLPFVDLSDEF